MALQVRRKASAKVRLISTLIAVFALVMQPTYGLVASQVANAAAPDAYVNQTDGDSLDTDNIYATISEAVDASGNNATISVQAGTYDEVVRLTQTTHLVGVGMPTLTNSTAGKNTLEFKGIAASGSSVKGFNLSSAVAGNVVKIEAGISLSNITIEDNILGSTGGNLSHLLYGGNLSNSSVLGNTFNVANGIKGINIEAGSSGNTFSGNIFAGTTDVLAFAAHTSSSFFINNNLSGLNSTYAKVVEFSGTGNTVSGTTYGNNQITVFSNSGEFRGVFSTFAKALTVAQYNDTLEVQTGLYAAFTAYQNNLTIKAASGATPVVGDTPNGANSYIGLHGSHMTVDGLTVNGNGTGKGFELIGQYNTLIRNSIDKVANGVMTATANAEGYNAVKYNTITNSTYGLNPQNGSNEFMFNNIESDKGISAVNASTNKVQFNNFTKTANTTTRQAKANGIALDVRKNWWGSNLGTTLIEETNGGVVHADKWLCEKYQVGVAPVIAVDGSCTPADTTAPTGEVTLDAKINPTELGIRAEDNEGIDGYAMAIWNEDGDKVATNKGNYGLNAGNLNAESPFIKDMTDQMVKPATQGSPKVDIATLPDGVYTVKLSVYDTSKNQKNGITETFRVDHTAPKIDTVVANFANNDTKNIPTYSDVVREAGYNPTSFNIAASDTNGSGIANIRVVVMKKNTNGDYKVTNESNNPSSTAMIDTSELGEGEYRLVIQATDKASNKTSHNVKVNFTVDKTGPVADTVMLDDDVVTASTTTKNCEVPAIFHAVSGTANFSANFDDSLSTVDKVQYRVQEILSNGCSKSSTLGLGYVNMIEADGTWSGSFDTGIITDDTKSYSIHIVAKDSQGNVSERNIGFNVDNTVGSVIEVDQPLEEPFITVSTNPGAQRVVSRANRSIASTVASPLSPGIIDALGQRFADAQANLLEDGETLGVSDKKSTTDNKGDVLAATDDKSGCGKFLGLCWYWWIPIAVAVLGAIWFYLASRRESDPDPFSGPARRQ